ncbi:MAG: hypothetical protein OJF59_002793 [Cytophagales bacterium]|jgi:uncharacterized protein (DUF1330 family)|nr:DUF1330 domain-containing protein [Bacteroidota bacterium]MBS1982224.1 DUF1330 domain-containing protein [Bacteroidota bacterium]WHZ09039.1 MAG: hypothetical protein OJF59_002793 [Cytophagales bacterium]
MPAYIVVQVEVKDSVRYEAYKNLTTPTLAKYHGRFIVRGAKTEMLEGEWDPKRLVILEFPTQELAKSWWSSDEYAPAKLLRQQTANTKMILVEGYEGT